MHVHDRPTDLTGLHALLHWRCTAHLYTARACAPWLVDAGRRALGSSGGLALRVALAPAVALAPKKKHRSDIAAGAPGHIKPIQCIRHTRGLETYKANADGSNPGSCEVPR